MVGASNPHQGGTRQHERNYISRTTFRKEHELDKIKTVLTCVHCGEPIDHVHGVWFHPYRRFRGERGALPTLCDFGERVGPTRATPVVLTPADKEFLCSIHVATDEENFLLEALWLDWQHANFHSCLSPCARCGASLYGQHALDCKRRAAMIFVDDVLRLSTKRLSTRTRE